MFPALPLWPWPRWKRLWQDAGLDRRQLTRDELRDIGVIVGSGGGSQEFTEEQYRLYYAGLQKQCSVYVIPTSTIGTLASEVSMRFGFRGLSHVISTGCTSSTDAIGYAFRTHPGAACSDHGRGRRGCADRAADPARLYPDADSAPAVGIDARTQPRGRSRGTATALCSAKAPGSSCWKNASRLWRAEPRSTARSRATVPPARRITGCAWKSAARSRPAPWDWRWRRRTSGRKQVQYVSYHGTSTELNDRIETRAVKLPSASTASKLAGSSLKSMIGHPQGACGAAGIAATLLAMRDGCVPPTINLDTPDPDATSTTSPGWAAANIEYAVANCIAFGSKNSAMALRCA